MLKEKLNHPEWVAPVIAGDIPHGDMPGDKVQIGEDHIKKANVIFPVLLEKLKDVKGNKAVVSVFGGSGVGKSEIASLLAYYLNDLGIGAYVMSGDNYPRRIPLYNDAERLSVFRANGLKGMLADGVYTPENQQVLNELWADETDPDPKRCEEYLWLASYQRAGRKALTDYLGTELEQDYAQVNGIISNFKNGEEHIFLKRMGRKEEERWYDEIDFSNIDVLIIEWTHGGSYYLNGLDVPIMLNSTPEETRAHRRARARDGKTDSAFTTMVLEIEQGKLDARREAASIVISKAGEII